METSDLLQLLGLAVTLIIASAGCVFTLVRYLQASFERVHENIERVGITVQAELKDIREDINCLENRVTVIETKCNSHHKE